MTTNTDQTKSPTAPDRTSQPTSSAGLALVVALFGGGCDRPVTTGVYQGYLEAEYIYVASPYGGALRELNVQRGENVKPGQPLFALDPEPEAPALQEATEKLHKAEAQLADARKGRRPSELEALEAQLRSARSDWQLAEQLMQRREQLSAANAGAVAAEALDESRSRVGSLRAQTTRLTADLETARLGSARARIWSRRRPRKSPPPGRCSPGPNGELRRRNNPHQPRA